MPEAHGAVGDGVTNDRGALEAAAAEAVTSGCELALTAPAYYIGGLPVTFPDGTRVRGSSRLVGGMGGGPVVNLTSGTTLSGVTVENTATGYGFAVNILTGATDVTINGCTFVDAGGAGVGVYLNNQGIRDVTITRCVFHHLSFGVLSNSKDETGAWNLDGLTIHNNVFASIASDGVEINHPYGGAATGLRGKVRRIRVTGNTIIVDRGAGRTSGFGVGIAGACDVRIADNWIAARYEGVHVEDDARDVWITDNTVHGVEGPDLYAGIHVLTSCVNVKIRGNTIRDITGPNVSAGILASYDQRPTDTIHVTVTDNHVENVAGNGITVSADNGGNFRVHSNTILDVAGSGVVVSGNQDHGFHVHDNTITGCGEYGVQVTRAKALARPHTLRDNTIAGATSGELSLAA